MRVVSFRKRDGGQLQAKQKISQKLSFIVDNAFILRNSLGKIMLDELPCRNSHYLLNIVNPHFSQIIKYLYHLHTWQRHQLQQKIILFEFSPLYHYEYAIS